MTTHSLSRHKAVLSLVVACAAIAGATGAAVAAPTDTSVGTSASSQDRSRAPLRAMSVVGTTGAGPNALVMDDAGNIYTADSKGNTVTKVTPRGTSAILGTTGEQPMSIALDRAGNVYTSNGADNTVTKITPAGVSTVLGTTGRRPMGIQVDAAGNVFTSNYLDNTVTKITPGGTSSVFGTTGRHPLGLALDAAGNVYTADEASNTITKITPDGKSATLGETGGWPQAIAIDTAGNLYTANWNTANVSKVSKDGKTTILGNTGRRPIGITVDAAGNVYVSNDGGDSISRITPSGKSSVIGITERRPSGITVDAAGNVYTVNFLSNTVTKLSPGTATSSNTLTLSTVTVSSPGNRPAWIIPFYNDVYETQQSCLDALPAVQAATEADPDPAVQKGSTTTCMGIGAVPYTFDIGETEITTAQWVTFLNTVDPQGNNRHFLWDEPESAGIWPKYGSINRDLRADPGQRYYVASPGWANRPYNSAAFERAARFVNSLYNGTVVSKATKDVRTVSGAMLKTTVYTVKLSTNTETGMYTMSNRKATRNAKKGFAVTSQNEWVKAAYFDPKGGGKFSYWDYPTNPGRYVNCPVDVSGCAEGDQPNATVMDADGNVINADQQPLASFEAVPGTAPDWCPAVSKTAQECATDTPYPPILPYNGNVSPVGQALTRSPWGTLDQGGNVVEVLDTISPPPPLTDPKIVWRRWHGGVVTATAYQMWLSAVGTTPESIPGIGINPWRGLRISVRGL